MAFTRRFGEIEFNIFGERSSVPGSPEIVVVSNVTEDGRPICVRRAGENWHSDMCYALRPPRGTILYALEIPELLAWRWETQNSLAPLRHGMPCRSARGGTSTGAARCLTLLGARPAAAPAYAPNDYGRHSSTLGDE